MYPRPRRYELYSLFKLLELDAFWAFTISNSAFSSAWTSRRGRTLCLHEFNSVFRHQMIKLLRRRRSDDHVACSPLAPPATFLNLKIFDSECVHQKHWRWLQQLSVYEKYIRRSHSLFYSPKKNKTIRDANSFIFMSGSKIRRRLYIYSVKYNIDWQMKNRCERNAKSKKPLNFKIFS